MTRERFITLLLRLFYIVHARSLTTHQYTSLVVVLRVFPPPHIFISVHL